MLMVSIHPQVPFLASSISYLVMLKFTITYSQGFLRWTGFHIYYIIHKNLKRSFVNTVANFSPLQMHVFDGPMWYSTKADWYKKNLYAVFAAAQVRVDEDGNEVDEDEDEEEVHYVERIMNVTVAGFDSQTDPVFAINPRRPYYERERRHSMECSAPSSLFNSPAIFALWVGALLSTVGTFLR